jgi:AraC family transcriptional regulator
MYTIDNTSVTPESSATLRLSSRGRGWGPIGLERYDAAPAQYAFPEGRRKHQVFVSLSSGRARCERGGETRVIEAQPGTVVVQPAGMPVTWRIDTRLSFAVLQLDPAFFLEVAQSVSGRDPSEIELVAAVHDNDPGISNIAGVLSRELVNPQPGGQLYAEALSRILAVHLLRNYARGGVAEQAPATEEPETPMPAAVARAIRYLQKHLAEEVTLDDLAHAAYCSPFHLSRQFKLATGMTPWQYLIQLRVNHARHLVTAGAGERSLADVARAAGFADQSHLTRHMKRLLGVTPGMLRAA